MADREAISGIKKTPFSATPVVKMGSFLWCLKSLLSGWKDTGERDRLFPHLDVAIFSPGRSYAVPKEQGYLTYVPGQIKSSPDGTNSTACQD